MKINDGDREKMWYAIDSMRHDGVLFTDVLLEVASCWVESHREAFDSAQEETRRLIYTPLRGY